jgi:hypothetical protein
LASAEVRWLPKNDIAGQALFIGQIFGVRHA